MRASADPHLALAREAPQTPGLRVARLARPCGPA